MKSEVAAQTQSFGKRRFVWTGMVIVLLVTLLGVSINRWDARTSTYQGKTLDEWLSRLVPTAGLIGNRVVFWPTNGVWGTNPVTYVAYPSTAQNYRKMGAVPLVKSNSRDRDEAAKAINSMGKSVISELLAMLKTQDTPARRWITRMLDRQSWIKQRVDPAVFVQARAVTGFRLLGTNANSSVPDLARLLAVPGCCTNACLALTAIGTGDAHAALGNALAGSNLKARSQIAGALHLWLPDSSKPLFESLSDELESTNSLYHPAALNTLGHLWPPERALPMILPFLETNSDSSTRSAALEAIGSFGVDARAFAPEIRRAVGEKPGSLQFEFNQTLRKIGENP